MFTPLGLLSFHGTTCRVCESRLWPRQVFTEVQAAGGLNIIKRKRDRWIDSLQNELYGNAQVVANISWAFVNFNRPAFGMLWRFQRTVCRDHTLGICYFQLSCVWNALVISTPTGTCGVAQAYLLCMVAGPIILFILLFDSISCLCFTQPGLFCSHPVFAGPPQPLEHHKCTIL